MHVLLERRRPKRIALIDIAGVESPPEPALTLFGRSVCEALRDDVALGLLLEPIVTDGRCGAETLVYVPRIE